MLIEEIFPVQLGIYPSKLSLAQLNILRKPNNTQNSPSLPETVQKSHHGRNLLNNPDYAELKSFILESSSHFLVNTFGITNSLIVSNSWLNTSLASASQAFHTHTNSLISGTFYISFDPSIHPSLILRHPRPLCSFSSYEDLPIIPTAFNSPLYKPRYKQGDLLLWPSYLEHGFFSSPVPSTSTVPRITLSFNLNIASTLLHSYSLSFS
jgi:uncharacterized protein (TIGR02466 family)